MGGAAEIRPETPVQFVKGVGPERARALKEEGIETVRDLLFILPRRYEDRSNLAPIKSLKPGVRSTVCGKIVAVSLKRARRMPIFEAVVEATEEAIYNSLFQATTVTGNGRTVEAIPLDKVRAVLKKYGRPGK